MSNTEKSLHDLPSQLALPPFILQQLRQHGILTCHQLLHLSWLDLNEVLSIQYHDDLVVTPKDVFMNVSKAMIPIRKTALELYFENRQNGKACPLPWSFFLKGELTPCSIIEVVDKSESGASHFLLTLASIAASRGKGGWGGHVVYLTYGKSSFSAQRFQQIVKARFIEYQQERAMNEVLQSVHFVQTDSFKAFFDSFSQVEELLMTHEVKLLIVEGIGNLLQKDVLAVEVDQVVRSQTLAKMASTLKYLGEAYQIPVLVSSNLSIWHQEGRLKGSLGNTWLHSVNTSLEIRQINSEETRIWVAKSSLHPTGCFRMRIENKGIELEELPT